MRLVRGTRPWVAFLGVSLMLLFLLLAAGVLYERHSSRSEYTASLKIVGRARQVALPTDFIPTRTFQGDPQPCIVGALDLDAGVSALHLPCWTSTSSPKKAAAALTRQYVVSGFRLSRSTCARGGLFCLLRFTYPHEDGSIVLFVQAPHQVGPTPKAPWVNVRSGSEVSGSLGPSPT